MTEDQLEQETLAWLQDVGYTHRYGPDIASMVLRPSVPTTARLSCLSGCAKPSTA